MTWSYDNKTNSYEKIIDTNETDELSAVIIDSKGEYKAFVYLNSILEESMCFNNIESSKDWCDNFSL